MAVTIINGINGILKSCFKKFSELKLPGLKFPEFQKCPSSFNHPPRLYQQTQDEEERQDQKEVSPLESLTLGAPQLMRKYGSIVCLKEKEYFIANKEAFKYILKTNVNNYSKENITYDRLRVIFGQGLIVSEGLEWAQHRELLHPVFDRQRLQAYSSVIIQYTADLVKKWQKQIAVNSPAPKDFSVSIAKEMSQLTLKIAFSAFSHHQAGQEELETVLRLFEKGNPHACYFPILKPWVPTLGNFLFFRSIKKLDRLLEKIIQHREKLLNDQTFQNAQSAQTVQTLESFKEFQYTDALEILLTAKEKHNISLTKTQILHEYKTLLITGHETTGCTLAWACFLLAKNPEYKALMEEELQTVLQNRLPTLDDCLHLPITKAIFLETLRLYPAIWVTPRTSIEVDQFCGFDFPAKSYLLLNIYALHRNPEYWEDPETFYPPRFMNDAELKRDPFSYLPFSIGPHSCIGSNFAVMEGILVLATLWQQLSFELTKNTKNSDHKPQTYISLQPPKNLKMKVLVK